MTLRFARCVTVLAAVVLAPLGTTAAADLQVGKPFPDLRLPTLNGRNMSIGDFRGKKVILHVFASW